jgi:hypothetical protein
VKRLLLLLAVLSFALLVLAIVVSQSDVALFRRESINGGSNLATPAFGVSYQVSIATRSVEPLPATFTPVPTSTPVILDASVPPDQRPLILPQLPPGDPCPMSKGSRETVPRKDYIFCAGCFWFGSRPVYFALSFNGESEDATFSLDSVPYEDDAYRAKTPWVSRPDYAGPILVRGRQLDGTGDKRLRFRAEESGPGEELKLTAYGSPGSSYWIFWPSSMWVPGPGCYGVQIDTLIGTDIVVFRATRTEPASDRTPEP